MKEAISVTTIFQFVILFILLFTAIMCLTINNANAFGVKNEIVNMIELSKGNFLDDPYKLNDEIVNIIEEQSYRTTGTCDVDYVGYNRSGIQTNGNDSIICIKTVRVTDEIDDYLEKVLGGGSVVHDDFHTGVYYQIVVFYQLDIPIVNQLYNMESKGETKIIYGVS